VRQLAAAFKAKNHLLSSDTVVALTQPSALDALRKALLG
jgi:hypothetical protein